MQTISKNSSGYLQGLDTLRAIAALTVVWGHIELQKKIHGLSSLGEASSPFFPDGHLAVVLFFVLSGFLITTLLTREIESTGTVSFKKFYMRRILRIWPVYYAVLIVSYIFFSADYSLESALLCFSIFPNIAHALGDPWPTSPQVWSIGVEEQFYLVWPFLISILPGKRVIPVLAVLFAGYSLLPHFAGYANVHYLHSVPFENFTKNFFFGSKYNCMCIGGIIGYAFAKQKSWLKPFSNNFFAVAVLVFCALLWYGRFRLPYFNDEFYSFLFSCLILVTVSAKKFRIDTVVTKALGKISYGIYMYHWIVILAVLQVVDIRDNSLFSNVALYTLVFGGTILLSWISFVTYERFFLTLKKRFETA